MKKNTLQRLPLGLSTFSRIRNEGYLYVDKTEYAHNLITQGDRYFLSRPRRFGKSLFVSTLEEILRKNKPLFDGLWISASDYQWHEHGVIVLDLSAIEVSSVTDLRVRLCELLQKVANTYNLELVLNTERPASALEALVIALHNKFGRVAMLIDEYDSPILQTLNNLEQAEEVCEAIRRFFAAVKSLDKYITFIFITGVSSFAKAGIFSGLNNLKIITLDERWDTVCGYTDTEIDHYFNPHIQAWSDKKNISYDALRSQIKDWYNGYHFGADSIAVYNPFSCMNALDAQKFKSFWLETSTPSFLIKEMSKGYRMEERALLNLESFEATEGALGTFEVGKTPLVALMFQSGYLTITGFSNTKQSYLLGYPNYEVRTAAQQYLLAASIDIDATQAERFARDLRSALEEKNVPEVVKLIKSMFVRVPNLSLQAEEKDYHGLLQMLFGAAGLKAYSEHVMSHARIDMIIELESVNYLIELKINQSAEKAMEQIKTRKYYEAIEHHKKPIILLALNFHRTSTKFDIEFLWEELPANQS